MASLYTNENFPFPAVEELRHLSHDVLTIQETGHAGQAVPDGDVLARARAESRILVTLNRRHFIRLHQSEPDHYGIVVCTFDPDFVALARRIGEALAGQQEWRGQLMRINRPA